jgi:hypothetical protein
MPFHKFMAERSSENDNDLTDAKLAESPVIRGIGERIGIGAGG